jgi:hypothetical protein
MEIINKNIALLSNNEVYLLLKEREQQYLNKKTQNKKTKSASIPSIISDSIKHLESTSCTHQNEDIIKNFLNKCLQFELTKVEKLQLLNQRPTNAVELQLLIESSEERFTLEQMDEILDFVNQTLPLPEADTEELKQEGEGEEEEERMQE